MGERFRGMASRQPAARGRLSAGAFSGRRRFRTEHQPEPGGSDGIRAGRGSVHRGHRGPRRGTYCAGGESLRDRAHGQPGACHTAHGSVAGRGSTFIGFAPGPEMWRNEMGVDAVTRAVLLDRDCVINRVIVRAGKAYPPSSPAELEINPDAPAALARLKRADFLLLVVTNQPDVARGTQTPEIVEAIHAKLREALPIDDFFVCYHDDGDG